MLDADRAVSHCSCSHSLTKTTLRSIALKRHGQVMVGECFEVECCFLAACLQPVVV